MAAGYTREESLVALYEIEGSCSAGNVIASVRQPGALDEIFLTERNGDDDTLLVLSTGSGPRMRDWRVWSTDGESIWDRELATAPNLEDGAAVFGRRDRLLLNKPGYTLALREGRRRTWLRFDGSTLEEAPAPGRSPNPPVPQFD